MRRVRRRRLQMSSKKSIVRRQGDVEGRRDEDLDDSGGSEKHPDRVQIERGLIGAKTLMTNL